MVSAVVLVGAVVVVSALAMCVTAAIRGTEVSGTQVFEATWPLILFVSAVTAVGFAISSWRPGIAGAAAGGFVAVSFLVALLIPLLGLPTWLLNVSVFGLYGQPLADGVVYWKAGVLALVAVILGTAGARQFGARDIAK
jgi:ABC-2 type transport system permease protein